MLASRDVVVVLVVIVNFVEKLVVVSVAYTQGHQGSKEEREH